MKLGLGTVQFGLNYGISNRSGQVTEVAAAAVLAAAAKSGVDMLDTARAYGDAEKVLGRHAGLSFRIITKFSGDEGISAEASFADSLVRLNRSRIYGVLLHRVSDLTGPEGKKILAEMQSLKARGLVEKIGVSVYERGEIDLAFSMHPFDLVQAPVNVLDQRLLSGTLGDLKKAGVEIHSRSALLQGLLMMDPTTLTGTVARAANKISSLQRVARGLGMTMLEACLGFVCRRPEIDRVLIGVCNAAELAQAVAAERAAALRPEAEWDAMREFSFDDENVLNPSKWEKSC